MAPLSDPAAERAVLSALFHHGTDAHTEVADLLAAESFTVESNQGWWKVFGHLLGGDGAAAVPRLDLPSVLSAVRAVGLDALLDTPDERRHLRGLTQLVPELGNVRRLAGKVRKLQVARELQAELALARQELGGVTGDEAVEAILAMAENRVFDFVCKVSATTQGGSRLGEGLDAYLDHVLNNPVDQVGLSSGWKRYDRAIGGGFRPGTVSVIGARMKVGKSQAGMNIAGNVAVTQGFPVWYGDTELDKKDHWHRQLACLADVPVDDIETGRAGRDPAKRARVLGAKEALKKAPYRFEPIAGLPFEQTLGLMRRWVLRDVGLGDDGLAKPCLMVFDYLKLMDAGTLSKDLKEYQVLGFMMTALHNFAKRYGVPILLLVQLNRDGIDSENTDAVSGSDRVGWLCSNLCYLKWQGEEELAEQRGADTTYSHKLVYLVGRHGKGLARGDYINMNAQYEFGRLTEGPLKSELEGLARTAARGFEVEAPDEIVPG